MSIKDVYNVGNDIMDAVNDAVNTGDFSSLNETLKNVTGAAAGTTADALYGLQGKLQGDGGKSGTNAAGTGGAGSGQRTYGHAGYASENLTEQYMQRASGARHHTTYTSKLSPFLQRRISRGSGTGTIASGVVLIVFSLMGFLFSGLMGLIGSAVGTGFSAMGLVFLVVTLGLAVLGGILVKKGNERKKLVREYYEYGKIAGTSEYLEINKLARAMGESRETVLDNLEKMISEDMLPASWFDRQKTTLMLSERVYNEYLQLERERQEQELEEAKARMQERASQVQTYGAAGTGLGQDADGLDDEFKPHPEDAKLPEEARKIVEEGLLYMGRIRKFNDDIGDEEISLQLEKLELTMKRIIEQIRKDPSSAPNLRRLMVYYLPTTMKLLQAYTELDRQPIAGENIKNTKREITDAMATINVAFENLLDSLFQDMAWDISSDISVMKTMMAQDGLTGDRMRKAREAAAREAAAQNSSTQPFSQAAGTNETFDSYTEGYSDELGGGQAVQTAGEPLSDPEEDGIHLTFGQQ